MRLKWLFVFVMNAKEVSKRKGQRKPKPRTIVSFHKQVFATC